VTGQDARLTIRRAGPADADFLADMLVEAANWRPEGKRSRAGTLADPLLGHYIDGWPQPGDLGLVAELGGKPAGAAWLRFFPASGPAYGFVGPDVPELVIGLRAECRGQGAGRALLRELADAARAAGIRQISLSAGRANYAHRLYLAEGYRVVGGDDDSDTMVKDL
jgi:GNAT superfamily N-acetyltransferase